MKRRKSRRGGNTDTGKKRGWTWKVEEREEEGGKKKRKNQRKKGRRKWEDEKMKKRGETREWGKEGRGTRKEELR